MRGKRSARPLACRVLGCDGIERDFEHDVRFHFAITAAIDDRVSFEVLGQLRDLHVR